MRHHRTFVCAAALVLPLCSPSLAQPCSQATVRGIWAHYSRLIVMTNTPGSSSPVPVPFAGLGIMKVDQQGRYTDHATASAGGQVQEFELPGTIQVNPDCTGTDTWTFGGEQMTGRLVILNNGNEMWYMPTEFPESPAAGIAHFRRLSWGEPQCGGYMVHGVYAGPREGTQMMPVAGQSQPIPVPFSAIHTATFRYDGTGAAASTASLGGTIVDFEFPDISIAVNPDCTATMKYTGISKQFPGQRFSGTVKYIVLNHGNELIGLDTEANTGLPGVVLDNLKRISMVPIVSGR